VDGGGSATIADNHITEIRDTPFRPCQNGLGVLIGRNFEGELGSGTVVHNLIDRYQKGGVVVDGLIVGESSLAEVAFNEIVGTGMTPVIAQNGVQVSRNAIAEVPHNRISLSNFGPLDTVSEGVILFQVNGGTHAHHNVSFLNDDGIGLHFMSDAEVSPNRTERNDFDGLYANPETAENLLAYNRSSDNLEHDCHDDSIRPIPARSRNIWHKNHGLTENKPGLCKH